MWEIIFALMLLGGYFAGMYAYFHDEEMKEATQASKRRIKLNQGGTEAQPDKRTRAYCHEKLR